MVTYVLAYILKYILTYIHTCLKEKKQTSSHSVQMRHTGPLGSGRGNRNGNRWVSLRVLRRDI